MCGMIWPHEVVSSVATTMVWMVDAFGERRRARFRALLDLRAGLVWDVGGE